MAIYKALLLVHYRIFYTNPTEILEECYAKALDIAINETSGEISNDIKSSVDIFIEKIDTDKSLVQVIITSLLKKIISPEQDIRYHMAKFENGYSARVLDTKVTSPFFKKYFPTYANKETAFLTKATRAEIVWNFTEGKKLPFRSKQLIEPFLTLEEYINLLILKLDDSALEVQRFKNRNANKICLIFLFRLRKESIINSCNKIARLFTCVLEQ